jgi:hypothetical protein
VHNAVEHSGSTLAELSTALAAAFDTCNADFAMLQHGIAQVPSRNKLLAGESSTMDASATEHEGIAASTTPAVNGVDPRPCMTAGTCVQPVGTALNDPEQPEHAARAEHDEAPRRRRLVHHAVEHSS